MRTARLAAVAFVALSLGGCGGWDQPQPRFVDPSTVATSAPPATGAVGGGRGWPHGVVTTTFDQDNPILRVSDPRTGAQLLRVDLPKARKNYWDRMSFSADWSWVGWTTGKNPVVLHVAQPRDSRYGAIATLTSHGTGGRITMRRLAPTSLGLTSYLVGSPDGSTVLFWVPKDGWYSVPTDGSAAPKWEFPTVGVGAERSLPIDWI